MKTLICSFVVGGAFMTATPAWSQRSLEEASSRARYAWTTHDSRMLATSGDSLLIRLPGEDEVRVKSGQAARLIRQFLEPTEERALQMDEPRTAGDDQGYAEGKRHYVVRGTSDVVTQTVFFGFRLVKGHWRLTEVRVTP